ncbi:mannitol-1-phosphate dehydrogenase [Eimeria tenella]|uniref:Mannitol-1-phosphate dehydrogenase n=1 Tax=Eimeria tenella TaxID=5802 RepID=U6KQC9_EIMTE|nr:mannitol-1-phosphate dehydrogenase [Eimeria tenella]CDJ40327.1 mannitol-1-phosphate dehydrogenase [Eimeria tenella]|eukprot:XP_013231077.1 mannitol-1-phosphate dehydrogenase [Eimeria tenella]
MLRSNVEDLVVLQRQSEDFEPLLSAAKREGIPVFVNGEKVCELRVYVHPNEIEELIQKLENKKLQNSKSPGHTSTHLVLTNDSELALKLAKAAKSLSCSLGPAMETALLPLLSQLPDTPKTEQVLLYACENDHAAVARLKEQLQQKVLVLPCMVDRICAARNIFADKIEVSAEPYEGEIVVLERPQFAPPPPFGGPNVHAPQLRAAAHYLCQRKIGLVNGMHTTLAFLTACSRRDELLAAAKEAAKPRTARSSSSSSSSGSSSSADAEGSSSSSSSSESPDPLLVALRSVPLLKETEMQQQQKETMWAWLTARCLQVLWEHDKEVIKRTHNLKTDDEVVAMLLNYGKKTLARFSTVDDTAGRVLGGGVVNRFHTRLLTIYTFLEQHMFGSVPLASTLLKHATISAFEMIDEVRRLVDQSRIFVEK